MKNRKSRLLILLVMLLVSWHYASAVDKGSVSNVRFKKSKGKYVITYDLKSDAIVNLRVKAWMDGKNVTKEIYVNDKKENEKVTGDVGYVMAGTNKVIEWKFTEDAELSEITNVSDFIIEPKNIFNPVKTTILGTFGYSVTPKQMSYGLLIGLTSTKNGWGGFAHFRSNYNFGVNPSGTCDADGKIDGLSCFYTGQIKYLYYVANAGVMFNMLKEKRNKSLVALGLGIGYGQRNVYWQMDNGDWAYNKDLALSGVSAEMNIIGSIKGFTLMAGVNTLNFKYVELEVGIGVTF